MSQPHAPRGRKRFALASAAVLSLALGSASLAATPDAQAYTRRHRPVSSPSATATTSPTVAPTATATATDTATATTLAASSNQMANDTGVAMTGTSLLYVNDADREAALDRIAASGSKWLRFDVAASQTTWVNSNQYDWSHLDTLIASARRRNLKILGVISGLPVYARPAGTPASYGPTNDAERAAFAAFARTVAARYQGQVAGWEIWNEANLVNYWSPGPSAYNYVQALAAARNAIKQVDPSVTVVSSGTGGAGANAGDIDGFTWLDQTYANGLAANSDAVAVHLYTNAQNHNLGEFLRLDAWRQELDSHGDTNKQIWATEAGGPSGGNSGFTESEGGQMTQQILKSWQTVHDHGPLMLYTLYDDAGANLGLFHEDGTPKLVFNAVSQLLNS